MSKRAIILAGGMGTRLKPYTVVLPKPLMPIGEFPILEVIVRQLICNGFDHITMAVNHQAEIIRAFFQEGEKWGIKIDYSLEDEPLGTMGPLQLISDLPENFLVMNGDILTDIDFSKFYDNHVLSKDIFTISSYVRQQVIDYGVLDTSSESKLIGFREKPEFEYEVSMGIYMVSARAVKFIPEGKQYG
ncbi:nucleotidyltransferase family protein, partial [bacterium]|nr:nucleotidyltransferase family protein [bacterium]